MFCQDNPSDLRLHGVILRAALLVGVIWAADSAAVERVSVASDGTEGDLASTCAGISRDGRFIAFHASATNLVAGDTNEVLDVFVHDSETGTTERVSVSSAGEEADDESVCPVLSGDGRFVAFASSATNLVAGDSNDARDVFVHDRQSGTTERVSVDSAGAEGDDDSANPAISDDGRFVAFTSAAANLVAGDGNDTIDVFVRDRQTATTERVSVASDGTEADGDSGNPDISADGRFVVFDSIATQLVAGDANAVRDVFVHDRQTGVTERVSLASDGSEGDGNSSEPAISAAGRWIAFESAATQLVPGDTNAAGDIFVHDRQTATTERASVADNGLQVAAASASPDISGNGVFVVFSSGSEDLVPDDTNGLQDIFVRDVEACATTRASLASDGSQADGSSGGAGSVNSISGDGLAVAFQSNAANLVAGDANGAEDVFRTTVDVAAGATHEYAAKIVCGTQRPDEELRAAPGFYATSVNIHNPNRRAVRFFKKLALTHPPGGQTPGEILPIAQDELLYDEALQSDCVDLAERLELDDLTQTYVEGFLVVQTSASLDVTAVYTTAALSADGDPGAHSSIHIDRVEERLSGSDLGIDKEAILFTAQSGNLLLYAVLYTLTVENGGPDPATAIHVFDQLALELENALGSVLVVEEPIDLPPGGAIINVVQEPPGDAPTASFDLELGDLEPGGSIVSRFLVWGLVYAFDSPASALLRNTATVDAQGPELLPLDNSVIVETVVMP